MFLIPGIAEPWPSLSVTPVTTEVPLAQGSTEEGWPESLRSLQESTV